jgi:hypothetical protein
VPVGLPLAPSDNEAVGVFVGVIVGVDVWDGVAEAAIRVKAGLEPVNAPTVICALYVVPPPPDGINELGNRYEIDILPAAGTVTGVPTVLVPPKPPLLLMTTEANPTCVCPRPRHIIVKLWFAIVKLEVPTSVALL